MLHIFGIRHHGPGSSKNILDAIHHIKPDILLIEGPPEGEQLISWVNNADMKPPVAMLAYVQDNPKNAVFYPFTEFSPEWNAMKYGLEHKIPVRFIDMPLIHKLAEENNETKTLETIPSEVNDAEVAVHKSPMSYLANISGFDDAEEWWEHQFELSHHPVEVFDAIGNAFQALREQFPKNTEEEQIREAFMRTAIRKAQREMYSEIVVVCGAWHVPALKNMPSQKEDDALIKNIPKTKIETTWIPWTNNRLSFESGYGAGVESPGWYQHVWENPKDEGVEWLSKTAHVFRNNKVDISSAHIIEAVRLSRALASMRNLQKPGLKEHLEATQTVMCMGDDVLLQVIWKELIVGHAMGNVPEGAPQSPLQSDFEKQVKSLRLKLTSTPIALTIDLREQNDLNKSIFLHRLLVLNIPYGRMQHANSKGTFKEVWTLCWEPELMIQLIERAVWGNSIDMASNNFLANMAKNCMDLSEITETVQKALPAELHVGITAAIKRMDILAAATTDTGLLMDTFIPLVQISRYGNVRNTDAKTISVILDSVFKRMRINLPTSVMNINDDQALLVAEQIKKVQDAVQLLNNENFKMDWTKTIQKIIQMRQVAAIIHATACKILYDVRILDETLTANEFSKALSTNNEPNYSANWIEGFLKDGATTLLLDDTIWNIVNAWVKTLDTDIFFTVVPLLRRTFSTYNAVEKKKIALRVTEKSSIKTVVQKDADFNRARAEKVLPVLEKMLCLTF